MNRTFVESRCKDSSSDDGDEQHESALVAAEVRISRAEALIECQKKVLEGIVAGEDLGATLELLTSALEENTPRKAIATIMVADEAQQTLRPIAGKNAPAGWREAISSVPIAPDAGSCGCSAYSRERVVAPDISCDPRWQEVKEAALKAGLRACWSTPILSTDGTVLGTYAIYYFEPASPTPEEIEMVEMMTRTAAVAIQKAALSKALQKAVADHREAESLRQAAILESSDDAIMRNRLAAIVESTDDAIIGLDLEGKITAWNRGAVHMFGYSTQEAIGNSVTMLLPPGLEDEEPRILRRLVNGERIDHYETVRRRKDGTQLDVSLTVSAIHDSAGKVIGASKISRDITEAKRQQQALKRSEEELRAMANSIHQLAWMAHPDGYIYWYNQRWFDYTGTTIEQMEGWGWQSVHDPSFLPSVLEYWKKCVAAGEPFEMEFPLRGADGVYRWFLTRVSPFRDEKGNVVRWFGTNTEVDELRRTQQALKEETRSLEVLNDTGKSVASELELGKIVQIVTDSATKLTGAKFGAFIYNNTNEQGESYLLYALSGATREAFERLGHPRVTPLFAPTFRGEPPVRSDDVLNDPRYENWAAQAEGKLALRSFLAVPVISSSGEVFGGLFFGHPEVGVFSERAERLVVGMAAQAAISMDNARLFAALREAREQLTQHNQRLEEEVTARTAALRETIQQLEAFSYSISHDMRSPLRAMQGYADALLSDYRQVLDETAIRHLERINRAAKRMDLLIQDVLAYSRVANGEIKLTPVDVQSVIADVIQNYPALQPDLANITIRGPIPKVIGHEAYITQIVSNYLGNAVKFIKPGTFPTVEISAREEGEMLRISFRDNGIGISPEQQKLLFQIFGRVYSEKKFEGTGIGLAIVKKAAERMGGAAGVKSELGQGSEFFVLLKKA